MQDPAPQKEELLATTQACEPQELVVASSKLNVSQQCVPWQQRANSILGCVNSTTSRLKEVINSLYLAFIRLHTECWIQFGVLQHKKDIDKLEQLQQRPPKWWGLENLPCEEKLGELGLFSLGQKWLWGDLTAAPQCLQGGH